MVRPDGGSIGAFARPEAGRARLVALCSALALAGVMLALAQATAIHRREVEALAHESQLARERIVASLELERDEEISALHRMARRMLRSDLDRSQWEADARQYVADFVHLRALEWVDSNFLVRWIVPLDGNEAALDLDLGFETRRREALRAARDGRTVMVSRTIELVQGGRGFLVYLPLFQEDRFRGFLLGVYDTDSIFASIPESLSSQYAIAVFDGAEEIFRAAEITLLKDSEVQRGTLSISNLLLNVEVTPGAVVVQRILTPLPEAVGLFGSAIAICLAFALYFGGILRGRARTLSGVNEQLRSEIARREQAEQELIGITKAVEGASDAIGIADAEGRHFYHNRAFAKLFEYPTARDLEAAGGSIRIIRDQAFAREAVGLAFGGESWTGELELVTRSGRVFPAFARIDAVKDESGNVIAVIGIIADITERTRAEEERLGLERQVQHAQKLESLGILAGGIAHDFNNLLVAILGNADLALDELPPMSPARYSIQEIEKASIRAAELAKQMLAYSGKGRFVIEPIDIGALVEEMAQLVEVSISKNTVLEYDFGESLPSFNGDVTQIGQVIMNLITNASEAIGDKRGVIALSTGAVECDRVYLDNVNDFLRANLDEPLSEGLYVYLEVADTGSGMDPETVAKVFDPFFTTKFTGRGLGMSAVLGIVRGHKGALEIYSEVGKGTTFRVLLPANEAHETASIVRSTDGGEAKEWRGSGIVLLADDEETVCTVCTRMLERMGFSVLTAPDGREAVKAFREHADEIICVLLDLTMPIMDGEEAFREMQRLRPGVPVILCSGYNEPDAIERFAGQGLAGFIQKPFRMRELRRELGKVLRAEGVGA